MAETQNHYQTLGVAENASAQEIRKAYLNQARQWHPDKNPDNKAEATKKFQEINAANETLSDPAKRAEYDRNRQLKQQTPAPAQTQPQPPKPQPAAPSASAQQSQSPPPQKPQSAPQQPTAAASKAAPQSSPSSNQQPAPSTAKQASSTPASPAAAPKPSGGGEAQPGKKGGAVGKSQGSPTANSANYYQSQGMKAEDYALLEVFEYLYQLLKRNSQESEATSRSGISLSNITSMMSAAELSKPTEGNQPAPDKQNDGPEVKGSQPAADKKNDGPAIKGNQAAPDKKNDGPTANKPLSANHGNDAQGKENTAKTANTANSTNSSKQEPTPQTGAKPAEPKSAGNPSTNSFLNAEGGGGVGAGAGQAKPMQASAGAKKPAR